MPIQDQEYPDSKDLGGKTPLKVLNSFVVLSEV